MLLETLKRLEVELQDPAVRSSREKTSALLHASFREFGRSGAMYSREEVLAHLSKAAEQPKVWAQDFGLEVLSEDLALLTYRSAQIGANEELERHTNRTSLWQYTDGSWKMRFHQGTATEPFARRAT